jgi:hypothetical protein
MVAISVGTLAREQARGNSLPAPAVRKGITADHDHDHDHVDVGDTWSWSWSRIGQNWK